MFQMTTLARKTAPEPSSKFEALFDGAQAAGKLTVRNFRAGDRIAPFGISGHRKVKDIFIDHKLAAAARTTFPIVMMGETIAWLPGIVRGRVGLVTERTENVLHLRAGSAMLRQH